MLALHAPEGLTSATRSRAPLAPALAAALAHGGAGGGRGARGRRLLVGLGAARRARPRRPRGAARPSRCWLGHGSSRPVRHAGGSPPGRRPANSSARREQPERLHERERAELDDLQRADDHAEDAHEARQQPGPHRVQRDQHAARRRARAPRAASAPRRRGSRPPRPMSCAASTVRGPSRNVLTSLTRPTARDDRRRRPSARRRSPAGRARSWGAAGGGARVAAARKVSA